MICPACGAGLSKSMVTAGECGYCHTALPRAPSDDLAQAIEKLAQKQAQAPQVVHVTKVEFGAPSVHVGGLFDSIFARLMGCFSGCLSAGISLAITGFIFAIVAWQLWMQMPKPQPPAPQPQPAPAAEHPRRGKR